MKKLASLLILSVFFVFACEKIEVKKTYYPNGKLKEEWEVTQDDYGQDVKDGYYKAWYDDGAIKHEIQYLEGKRHGIQKTYFRNGKVELEENYIFGNLSGKKKSWTKNGTPELEIEYVDGKPHGIWIRFWENGKPHHKINYRKGLKHGSHEVFDEEGNLEKTTWFAQGKMTDGPVDSTMVSAQAETDTAQEETVSDKEAQTAPPAAEDKKEAATVDTTAKE